MLDHPTGVGGRYSVLTMVGALPALLMGLDVHALRSGAQVVLDNALSAAAMDVPAAAGAALHHALAGQGRLDETVLWAYADKLATLGGWWRQLWAESLGKDGKGSTPVGAVGPVDQHSQLQLFRDGPGKALFTIIATADQGQGTCHTGGRPTRWGCTISRASRWAIWSPPKRAPPPRPCSRTGRPVRQIARATGR